jgi:hypothetical protein
MTKHAKRFIGRYPVAAFFILTYAISWAVWLPLAVAQIDTPLYKIGTFGPTLAALLLTVLMRGRLGLKRLLRPLLIWRVHVGWYLFSILSTAVGVLVAIGLHIWLGGTPPKFNDPAQLYLVIPAFLYVLFTSVVGEEIGWRGYALPRLQAKHSALGASLVLGLVWGAWHLPLFWMAGNFHQQIPISLFLLQTTGFSILYTWMYNHTRGSLLLAHLFHAASNTTIGVLPVLPMDTGGSRRPLWLVVGILWAVALIVVARYGPKRLSEGLGHSIQRRGAETQSFYP